MQKIVLFLRFFIVLSIMSGIMVYTQTLQTAKAADDSSFMLIEQSSRRVLYEHNADKCRPMASTTKIATAIAVLENYKYDLDMPVKIPDAAVGIEGSSVYLKRGEKLTVRQLLYGLMLRSGNDCAVALAMLTAGSTEKFAVMMNDVARKAGAANTNFVTPHGLHDDNHYTTAADLAKISAYAMDNEIFREIVSTKSYVADSDSEHRVMLNKNKILSSYDGGNGIKTGYTKKAGRCLVSSATRNGMTVICVALNCGPMFEKCASLMDYAFENYAMVDVFPGEKMCYAAAIDGREELAELSCRHRHYPLKKDGSELVSYSIQGVKALHAPIEKGVENGKLNIYIDKQLIFSEKLFTIYEVGRK